MAEHLDQSQPCWLWTGYIDEGGYGRRRRGRKVVPVHRASYEDHVGPIPPDLEIDHLCKVRHCYNPAHLEAVTHLENVRRSSAGEFWAAKTHCPKGHPYDAENTYRARGKRICLTCHRANSRVQNEKRKLRKQAA